MDNVRIPPAGDPFTAGGEAQEELLETAQAALAWFDRFDAHAPEGLTFGGEGRVRKQLRGAIRRARAEGQGAWEDADDADEAAALDDLRGALGRVPSGKERAAFLDGFRQRRAQLLGKVRGWEAVPLP